VERGRIQWGQRADAGLGGLERAEGGSPGRAAACPRPRPAPRPPSRRPAAAAAARAPPPPPRARRTFSSVPRRSWLTSTTSRMVGWNARSAWPSDLAASARPWGWGREGSGERGPVLCVLGGNAPAAAGLLQGAEPSRLLRAALDKGGHAAAAAALLPPPPPPGRGAHREAPPPLRRRRTLGPNTTSATTATSSASGAPTPRKEAATIWEGEGGGAGHAGGVMQGPRGGGGHARGTAAALRSGAPPCDAPRRSRGRRWSGGLRAR
jgi:hypothetical protein